MPSSPPSDTPSLTVILVPVLAKSPRACIASPSPVPVLPRRAFSRAAPPIPIDAAVVAAATNAWRCAISMAILSASAGVLPTLIAVLYASLYALVAAPPADSAMSVAIDAVIPMAVPILAATAWPYFNASAAPLAPPAATPPMRSGAISWIPSTPTYSATNCNGADLNAP